MTYKTFIEIVCKNRKYKSWVSNEPIYILQNGGRLIVLDGSRIFLERDIGPGPEDQIDLKNEEVDNRWAVREVFEAFGKGANK